MASNNDVLPDANRPLPQPMSTYHQQSSTNTPTHILVCISDIGMKNFSTLAIFNWSPVSNKLVVEHKPLWVHLEYLSSLRDFLSNCR